MSIKQIFYNTFSEKTKFDMASGSRPWDVLLILTKGSFAITFDSEEIIVSENEILYIPANVCFFRRILQPIGFHQLAFVADTDHPFYASLSRGKLSVEKMQVGSVVRTLENSALLPDNREVAVHCIERIMCEHYMSQNIIDGGEKVDKDIHSVLILLSSNFDKKIDVKELAKNCGLSYTGFLWKFEKQVGTTPTEYLASIRLRYAKQLLIEGKLTVSEIAEQCGYSNPYYFSNVFKDKYGQCPTAFRKTEQKTT